MSSEDRRLNSPQSVTRIIQILEALCAANEPVRLADLSRELKTPKSSLAALLRGLADVHFVVAVDGAYRLGPAAFGLGGALIEARRRLQSSDLIREGLQRLAEASGETVLYAVPDAGDQMMTYVEVVESRNAVRFAVSVGDRRPLYCTAGGRALLASWPEKALESYLGHLKPERIASHTITDVKKLGDVIAEVRKSGIAQTLDEAADGVTGTAAVIRDASGEVSGTLIVAAPSSRSTDKLEALARLVADEADLISRSLGYRPAQS